MAPVRKTAEGAVRAAPSKAARKAAAAKKAAAKPIGIEPVVRVGGHVATEDGWIPEED